MAKNGFFRRIADWFVRPAATGSLTTVLGVIAAVILLGGFATYRIQAMNADGEQNNQPFAPIRTYKLFEGTPAASYKEGAAGIVLPAVTQQGEWSAADVAKALTQVKNALIASHLDRKTLVNHDAAAYLALLTPSSREHEQQQIQRKGNTPLMFVVPTAKLAAAAPRVSGKTTVGAGKPPADEPGYLAIKTNYVWAYAFEGVADSPGAHVVIAHDEIEWRFYGTGAAQPGLERQSVDSFFYNVSCADVTAQVIAPDRSIIGDGTTVDDGIDWSKKAYDPQSPVDAGEECAAPTPSG
jgi:hypothetical protein